MLVRALLLLLLVLNAGVAAWWLAREPAPPPAPVALPPGVARLQLVSEAAPKAPAPPAATLATEAGATAAPDPGAAAPAAMTTAAMPAASARTPAASPEPATRGEATPPTRQCFSFGPFVSAPAADAAAAKVRPRAQKIARRVHTVNAATPGWRVFLPPHATPEAAQATAQRIAAAGFSDFIVVRQGSEANAIILGRYSSEDGAKRHAQALAAAGFAARVEPVAAAGEASTVWLDVVADAAFDPRRAQADIRAPQHRTLDCTRLR